MKKNKERVQGGYTTNVNQIREYGLSLPARKIKKQKKTYVKDNKIRLVEKEHTVHKIKKDTESNETILKNKLVDFRKMHKQEIKIHGEQTLLKEGFIYLISNKSFPGWIKAGMTIDFEARLKTYNICDPESRYKFEFVRWVDDRRLCEKRLLELLSEKSDKRKGEWFRLDKEASIETFLLV